jgi:AAA family ATP:ADP antiporter
VIEQDGGMERRQGGLGAFVRPFVDVRPGELWALVLSFAYFFFILAGYFILRPLREVVGSSHNSRELAVLFTFTLIAMVVANPVYGWIVSRWPRRVFIPWVYRFFGLNLLVFFVLWKLHPEAQPGPVSRCFFVWVSVFNLFIVSVFWSFMADLFGLEPSKRLFGCIAAGGSLGGIAGPMITKLLVGVLGTAGLLLVSLAFLELATQCVYALIRLRRFRDDAPVRTSGERGASLETAESGDLWNGLRLVVFSPYLLLIAAHFLVASGIGTSLYFEQSQLVAAASPDKVERTRIFATFDTWTNIATLTAQILLTKIVVKRLGIRFALILQPAFAVLSLVAMAVSPTLGVLFAATVLLRSLQHSLTRPAREMLFTVLGREVKYKAKSFVDTFVYRLGDQLGAWGFDGLKGLGLSLGSIAWATVPLTVVWCGVAAALGTMQRRFSREVPTPLPVAEPRR